MTYDPALHHRRSIRLPWYDYTRAGAYFVTICTAGRRCLFGEVRDGQMHFSDVGRIVQACWEDIPNHAEGIELDAFQIMPNHLHGVLWIDRPYAPNAGDAGAAPRPTSAEFGA
jgi:putative transposase